MATNLLSSACFHNPQTEHGKPWTFASLCATALLLLYSLRICCLSDWMSSCCSPARSNGTCGVVTEGICDCMDR